jgi:hypothetical protein
VNNPIPGGSKKTAVTVKKYTFRRNGKQGKFDSVGHVLYLLVMERRGHAA